MLCREISCAYLFSFHSLKFMEAKHPRVGPYHNIYWKNQAQSSYWPIVSSCPYCFCLPQPSFCSEYLRDNLFSVQVCDRSHSVHSHLLAEYLSLLVLIFEFLVRGVLLQPPLYPCNSTLRRPCDNGDDVHTQGSNFDTERRAI